MILHGGECPPVNLVPIRKYLTILSNLSIAQVCHKFGAFVQYLRYQSNGTDRCIFIVLAF